MSMSVHTNPGAAAAVRAHAASSAALQTSQNQVSTGLAVSSAVDNASVYAIAQGLGAEIAADSAVNRGLNQTKGMMHVAQAGAEAFSDMMGDLKAKIIEGMNPANTAQQQGIINDEYQSMLGTMRNTLEGAEFNGQNLLTREGAPFTSAPAPGTTKSVGVPASGDGETLTMRGQNLDQLWGMLNDQDLSSPAAAGAALAGFETAEDGLTQAMGQLGADARALGHQQTMVNHIKDTIEAERGAMIEKDMARGAMELKANQVKEQLSIQMIGIANQSEQSVLSLFR